MEDDHAAGTDGEQDLLRRIWRRDRQELECVGGGHGAPVAMAMELVEHAAVEPGMTWTEPSHRAECREQLVRLQQLALELGGGETSAWSIRQHVVAQLMPFVDQATHDLLVTGDMLTNHEKSGVGVVRGQDIQDARRRCCVRAVVERQGDEWPRVRLLKQDLRKLPAEAADHGTGPEQGSNDHGDHNEKVRDSLIHDLTGNVCSEGNAESSKNRSPLTRE